MRKAIVAIVVIGPQIASKLWSMASLRRSAKSVVANKRFQGGKEGAGLCVMITVTN